MAQRGLKPPAPMPVDDPAAAPPGDGAPPTMAGAQQAGNQATPEQQALYESVIHAAVSTIYSGKGADGKPRPNPAITERLALRTENVDESHQAITALASMTVNIVVRIEQAFQEKGQPLKDVSVLYHAASEIMGDLAELAGEPYPPTGKPIHDYSDKEMTGAWVRAVDEYQQRKTQSGELDKSALQHDWGQVTGAARAGNLDAVMPGLSAAAKELPQQGSDQPKMGDRKRGAK